MRQIDVFKNNVAKIESPMEMAGLLDSLRVAAALYCKENVPDEVIFEDGRLEEVTAYGISDYLDSEVPGNEKEANPFSPKPGKTNQKAIQQMSTDQLSSFLCELGWTALEKEECREWLLREATGEL